MRQKLKDFNELVMMAHSIFSLPFIFIAMFVAADGWFGWRLLILGALAAFTARNFAMAFNRYVDRLIDAKNHRTKSRPSVDGRISSKEMLFFMGANALGFIVISLAINMLAFWLSIPILFILAAYSYFKRFSEAAHLVLGVTLGLAPIAGAIAVSESIPLWSIALALGVVFWVAGFDILYSLQDMEFDKKEGLFSIPSRFGASRSLLIAESFHIFTIAFWTIFVIQSHSGFFAYLALLISIAMLSYEHYLVKKDFQTIDRAFFTVNGYLGILFFICIFIDRVL